MKVEINKKKTILEEDGNKRITYELKINLGEQFVPYINQTIEDLLLDKLFQIQILPTATNTEITFVSEGEMELEKIENLINNFIEKINEKANEYEKLLPLLTKINEAELGLKVLKTKLEELEDRFNKLLNVLTKKKQIKPEDFTTLYALPIFNFFEKKWFWQIFVGFLLGIGLATLFPVRKEVREVYKIKTDTLYVEKYKRDTIYLKQVKVYYDTLVSYIEREKRDTLYQTKIEKEKQIITKEKSFNMGLYVENEFRKNDKLNLNFGAFGELNLKYINLEGGIKLKEKEIMPYLKIKKELK
jgi:hypothetical protein